MAIADKVLLNQGLVWYDLALHLLPILNLPLAIIFLCYKFLLGEQVKSLFGDSLWVVGMERYGLEVVNVGISSDPILEDWSCVLHFLEVGAIDIVLGILLDRPVIFILSQRGKQRHWHFAHLKNFGPFLRWNKLLVVTTQQVGNTLIIFHQHAFPFQPLFVQQKGLINCIVILCLLRTLLFRKVRTIEERFFAFFLSLDWLSVEYIFVAIVELSGGVLDL